MLTAGEQVTQMENRGKTREPRPSEAQVLTNWGVSVGQFYHNVLPAWLGGFGMRRLLITMVEESRRTVLSAMVLFCFAMMFQFPRQLMFGPKAHGFPRCWWSEWIRAQAHNAPPSPDVIVVEALYIFQAEGVLPNASSGQARSKLFNHLPSPGTIPVFLELVEEEDVILREYCLYFLSWVKREDADHVIPILRRHLHDQDPRNQLHCANALWRLSKDRQAIEVLLTLSQSVDKRLAMRAINFLGDAGREIPELFDHLTKMLDHKDATIRSTVIYNMGNFGKRGVPLVQGGLIDTNKDIRLSAYYAALKLKADAVDLLPELRALRCDPDPLIAEQVNAKLPNFEREILAKAK